MPNNPVQIILNDRDFHQAPDPGQPPRNKDFFDGADKAFVAHQTSLLASIDRIIAEIRTSPYGPAAYLKVQMRNEALAKSYRPVWWLFKPDQFPCVGADAVGTLYFRAPLIYLKALRQRIEQAEGSVEIKYRRLDNEPYKAPSIARAEVGAIKSIEIAPPEQKRAFSTAAALAAIDDPRAVSGYQVELFETPLERVIADDPLGRIALRRSLERLLLSLGMGARSYLAFEVGRTPVLEVQLTTQPVEALIDNRAGVAGSNSGLEISLSSMDRNPERHETALNALQKHPLVRAILPPVLLELTDDRSNPDRAAAAEPIAIPAPQDQSTYPIVGVIRLSAWRPFWMTGSLANSIISRQGNMTRSTARMSPVSLRSAKHSMASPSRPRRTAVTYTTSRSIQAARLWHVIAEAFLTSSRRSSRLSPKRKMSAALGCSISR